MYYCTLKLERMDGNDLNPGVIASLGECSESYYY
jgi:hypothetical protein